MSAYEQIARGVLRFRRHVFPQRRAVYQALAHHQAPQVLFIGCIDSRVAPAELCHTAPGEMFVERTPGNLVPVYDEAAVGVSASIEYAVVALEVAHIIVCGHSDCGALKGLMHPEKLQVLPAVGRWLSHATEALAEVDAAHPQADEATRLALLAQANVRHQLAHLATHPSVRARMAQGLLSLHGWVYDIPTGQVEQYEPTVGKFVLWPPG
jgi:carbonic anhydrase